MIFSSLAVSMAVDGYSAVFPGFEKFLMEFV